MVRGRIQPTLEYSDLADCDLVIEAVTEDLDLKLEMWREVDGIVKADAYFATNTSSLPVTDQAAATSSAGAVPGAPLLQPGPGDAAARGRAGRRPRATDAAQLGFELGEQLRKTTVAARDNRGFIVNRLLVPYMLDAIRAHEQGVGSIEDIDTGMKAGASHPMGPLTLADFVGLDTLASIADVMHEAYGEERFASPPTLTQAGRRRALRPQDGPRASTTTRASAPSPSSSRRSHTLRRPAPARTLHARWLRRGPEANSNGRCRQR